MVISIALYIGFQQLVNTIEGEKASLLTLKDRVLIEQKELSYLIYNDVIIVNQMKKLNDAITNKEEVLEKVKELKLLSSLDEKVATAIRRIVLLDELQVTTQEELRADLEKLLSVADTVFSSRVVGISSSFTFNMINADYFDELEGYEVLNSVVRRTKMQIAALYDALEGSQTTIEEQYAIIDEQIAYYARLGYLISAGFAFIVIILSIFISLIIANRIAGSINNLKASLSIMASGDLTNKIDVLSKDEVGQLSKDMSNFNPV